MVEPFAWEKLGKIFDPADLQGESWMKEFAQSASALVEDEYVRVFFSSRPAPQQGLYVSQLGSIDLSRKDLTKVVRVCREPLLALGKRGTFDEFGTNPVSVLRHKDELRVYYAGWTRCESVPVNGAIGVAISSDGGASFQRLGDGPVLSYSPDEPFMIGSPRIRRFADTFYLFYVAGREWIKTSGRPEPVYKIRMATSKDGLNWQKHGRDLLPDKLGPRECQACADVSYRDGLYHMFYSYRHHENYKTGDGGYRMGYAWSEDLESWQRCDERVGMTVSESGWDSQMVNYPHVFEVDDSTYMLYQGNEMGRSGIGIARLQGGWPGR